MSLKDLHHAFTVDYNGITLELRTSIQVGAPTLTGPFDPKKKLVKFDRGVWDTGATGTGITQKVIDALGLVPTGMETVVGTNGRHDARTFMVDIVLPNNVYIPNVNVVEGDGESFDVLVGMDIIQMGDMAISNAGGKTKFSFCLPAHESPICLVEKSNRVNDAIRKRDRKARRGSGF